MKNKRKILVLLFVCIVFSPAANAFWVDQSVRLKREQSDAKLVLENATVTAITKDARGFMWFATEKNLMCYDGTSTLDLPTPKTGIYATKIAKTPEEIFFLYNEKSQLICFDRRHEIYLDIEYPSECDGSIETSFDYNPQFGLFAANENGLFKINYALVCDPQTKQNRIILTASKIQQVNYPLNLIAIAPNGTIYTNIAGTHDIMSYHPKTAEQKIYPTQISHQHNDNFKKVYKIFAFDQSFWFTCYWDDLVCYNITNGRYKLFCSLQNDLGISYFRVMSIARVAPGHYALATWSGLVNIYFDMSSPEAMNFYVENPYYRLDNQGLYIENRVISLFYDSELEILWTGAYGGGVVKYSNSIETHIPLATFQPGSVTEDKRGYIWLTAVHGGLYRSDLNSLTSKTTFSRPPNMSHIISRTRIYNDNRRHLWVSDSEGDIIQIDQFTGQYRRIRVDLNGEKEYRLRVNDMVLDQKNRLWIAADNRLLLYDVEQNKFTLMELEGVPEVPYSKIIEDKDGEIWIGTRKGLFRLSAPVGNKIRGFGGYEQMAGSDATLVYDLSLNSSGDIIATYIDKLIRIDSKKKDKVSLLMTIKDNELPCGSIFKIIDDRNGNTWFGSNSMIMTMKSGGSDVFTYSMSNNNRDATILGDGRMVWISENGIMYFRPDEVRRESQKTEVVLSRLIIRGRDVYANQEVGGQVLLTKSISLTDTLTFYENNKNFSLSFSDLTYSSIQKRVRYKLEPLMNDWETYVVGTPIPFVGLSNGTYKLFVKPLFADQSEGAVKELTIIIKPFWYNTIWVRLLMLIAFVAVILVLYNEIRKYWTRLKRRNVHTIYDRIAAIDDKRVVDVNSFTNRKLLIVGNNKIAVDKLTDMFADDFSVFHSKDSGAGLLDSLYHQPKVIICLMDMPDVLECCRKIKSNEKTMGIPIVVIDVRDVLENRVKAILAKADDYLCFDNQDDILIRQVVKNRMAGNEAIHQVYRRALKERLKSQGAGSGGELLGETSPANAFMEQLNLMILQNIKDPTFNVKRLAELMNTSQSTLYRRVIKEVGVTLIEAIRDVRLRRAGELLYQTNLTIQAVSEEVGYMDVATFRRHFVELYGITPSQFARLENAQSAASKETE